MTFRDIDSLSRRLPLTRPAIQDAETLPASKLPSHEVPLDEHTLRRFVHAYGDVAFGWKAADRLAATQAGFPVFPHKRYRWVYLAWRLLQDMRRRARMPIFEPVVKAVMIRSTHSGRPMRQVIEALLIIPDISLDTIAEAIGYDRDAIEAYAALYFDVCDRRDEHLFIRNLVYPKTRFEETVAGYTEHGDMDKLLLRLAYNRGLEATLHFAGFRVQNNGRQLSHAQAYELFQQELMSNGYMLSMAGFLNYRNLHPTLSAARQFAQATKIAGTDTGGLDDGISEYMDLRGIMEGAAGAVRRSFEDRADAFEAEVLAQ